VKVALPWRGTAIGWASSARSGEEGLRRVAFRLAAQTVALLLVMLIALEAIVYLTTQHALVGTLETTLKNRAAQADPNACRPLHLACPGNGPPPRGQSAGAGQRPTPGSSRTGGGNPGGGGGQPPPNQPHQQVFTPAKGTNEASAVYVNTKLHVVHADAITGNVLLDPDGARRAIAEGKPQCCSGHSYKGTEFLVYSAPLFTPLGRVAGAVQTSISEHQYQQTMQSLAQVLFLVTLLGLAASAGISTVLARRSLQPIRLAMHRQRDFVADAAHELRTPLAIQRTVGEVGMAEGMTDELQATIEQMLGENQHLTRLVEDLSLLARTDTDAVAIERQPVNLSDLVNDTAQELSYVAAEKNVTLESDVQANVTTSGDLLRLRQLLLILLDNALKHTPAGGTVRIALSTTGTRVRLQVSDSGPGIPPVDLPHVFNRFYRSDQARTREGTGLGLAIAKWIVEAHGGRLQASNAPAGGAVFKVTLG